MNTLGNIGILKERKIGFLCSRKISAVAVLRCYDWAVEQREKERCVVSGFQSDIEKDVLGYLLSGKQPIILVLARGMKKTFPPDIQAAISAGRLLILSPFPDTLTRASQQTALRRNQYIVDLADNVVVGYATPNGSLSKLLTTTSKPITFLVSPNGQSR